jgi:hypothetical protein
MIALATAASAVLAGAAPCRPLGRHLTLVDAAGGTVALPAIALHGEGPHQDTRPGEVGPALALTQFQRPGQPVIGWWRSPRRKRSSS